MQELSLLTANKSRDALKYLDGWQTTDDHKMIYREFICHDFMAAVEIIDQIADIAEAEKHHPDLHLTHYRNLRVTLTSHDVGGLSDKDFAVASKINALPFDKVHQQLQHQKTEKTGLKTKTHPKKVKHARLPAKKKTRPSKAKGLNRVAQRVKKS